MILTSATEKQRTSVCSSVWDGWSGPNRQPPNSRDICPSHLRMYMCYWVQACTAHCMTEQYFKRWVVGVRNSNFKRKARSLKKVTDVSQISSLSGVRIQAPFIVKGEGVKWDISCFWSAFEGDVLISFSLKSFTGGPGQDVSWELNKGILA